MPVANVRSKWSAGNLIFYESVAGNGAYVQYGEDGSGMDMKYFGSTAGNYMQWDESADSLLLVGTAVKFSLGSFTGAASGTGSVVSATATAPFKVFADDGGAAIGSGSLVRAGWFRNLQTYTGGNREQEATGVQGSLVSVAGTNRHNMSGVLGSYEARTSLTVGGQAATTDTWIQAGVLGRVGMSTGTLVVDTNAVLAGVAAMSNINSAVNETLTGDYVGFYVGAWASAIDFEIGLLIEGTKVTQGINVGKHSSTAVGPAVIISATNTAANRFYADDGGASIAIAASVPDVKNTLFRTLITKDNSSYNGRVHSLMGQLKSVDGEWGDEQWSAVHGYLELTQSSETITLQSYGVTAGVMATVETQGSFGVAVTHNLAGFAAISKLGYTGTFTDNTNTSGLYVGIYDSTNWSDSPTLDKWNHGLYVQAAAADKGIQVGELSSTTQVGLTLVSGSGYEAVSIYSDDGNATLTGGTPFAGIHTRTMLFQDQDEGTTLIGSWGQLKYYSGVDIGPARTAAVEGYNELLTTNLVTSGGEITCVNAVIDVVAGTFTVESGGIATGFHAKLTGAGEAVQDSTGILAGLKIDEGIATGQWGYGVYIADGATVIGINVGTCTTGIEFTGTTTNCISVPASATGITKLIRVGTWGNDVKLAADDEFIELLCQVSGATHTKPLVRFRMEGDAATNMTTGSIIALEALAYMSTTYTAHDMTAIVAHTGAKGTSALTSTAKMRAAYLKVEDLGNDLDMVSGSYVCPLWMEMQFNSGSTFNGNMYWVSFSKYGSETSLYGDAVFRFEDLSGGGWATSFILMDYARPPWETGGASGAAGSDAHLRCDIGGVHYSIALYAE